MNYIKLLLRLIGMVLLHLFRYIKVVLPHFFYPVQALRWTNRCDSCNKADDANTFSVAALSGTVIFIVAAIAWYATYANRDDVARFTSCLLVALISTALYGFIWLWHIGNITAMHNKHIYLKGKEDTHLAVH